MSFKDLLKEVIANKPLNLKSPHFYKADSDAEKQLIELRHLCDLVPDEIKPQVERDINMLAYGIAGEKNIAFELNNSYLEIIRSHPEK